MNLLNCFREENIKAGSNAVDKDAVLTESDWRLSSSRNSRASAMLSLRQADSR